MRVVKDELGNPSLELQDSTRRIAEARGITALHLSMTHDAGVAIAYVVAEAATASGALMREAVIDLGAIRANVVTLSRAVGEAEVMVVVKADAYGHGAVPVARAAVEAGATWLGVADLDEALALRAGRA